MVRFLHSHGALVSINHPSPGQELADKLITTGGVGADVIEIGTGRQVEELAPAFDVAARNAVFMTASGVSDDHGGVDWLNPDAAQRWLTGVWARSRDSADLCAAMRAGKAWIPFDGTGSWTCLSMGTYRWVVCSGPVTAACRCA
jgi:hypothetical protein